MKKKLNITQTCRDALRIMLDLPDAAHSVEHIVRVYDWCRELAKSHPQTDLKVLKVAAYWHDVGRVKQSKDKDDHNIKGALMVENYLLDRGADRDFVKRVKQAVLNHSFRCQPKTIEGKILHDADKLSFIGDHEIFDALDGFKDGFENKNFNKKILIESIKGFLEHRSKLTTYFDQGLILPEAKREYKKREKALFKIAEDLKKLTSRKKKKAII